jgi:hypothetical protein
MKTTTQKHRNQAGNVVRQKFPVCCNSEMTVFFEVKSVPVFYNILWDSRPPLLRFVSGADYNIFVKRLACKNRLTI